MPEGVLQDQIASSYSSEGILTISAPRVIKAPEGATVQEAMAAASKAYTTDDGKTAVKQVILHVLLVTDTPKNQHKNDTSLDLILKLGKKVEINQSSSLTILQMRLALFNENLIWK